MENRFSIKDFAIILLLLANFGVLLLTTDQISRQQAEIEETAAVTSDVQEDLIRVSDSLAQQIESLRERLIEIEGTATQEAAAADSSGSDANNAAQTTPGSGSAPGGNSDGNDEDSNPAADDEMGS